MRYKAVIIDDNVNTVKSLLVSIDWASLDIEIAGTAYDGLTGSELIRRKKPDIIITDINMPEMNGLQMIELINYNDKNPKVIIITGYDKFHYARRAIKLSVFDYILKPIDDNELRLSIDRAKLSLESDLSQSRLQEQLKSNNRKVRLLSCLTAPHSETSIQKPESENVSMYFLILGQCNEGISRPLLERISYENYPVNLSVVSVIFEDYLVIFCELIHEDPAWQKYAKNVASKLLSHSPYINIAVSGFHNSYSEIRKAFFESKKVFMSQTILTKKQQIAFHEEDKLARYPSLADSEEALEKVIIEDLNTESYEHLNSVLVKYTDGSIESIRTLLMIFSLKVLDRRLRQSVWPESIDRLIYGISKINSISEIKQWYMDYINEINTILNKEMSLHKLIKDVQNYIRLYASGGLTLKSTAAKFKISPNYLSSLIHKETGKTYQQHILEAKMEVAKQMLDDTRIKIEDIGYSIGYENYISFYKTFKTLEGLTPSEYRFRSRN